MMGEDTRDQMKWWNLGRPIRTVPPEKGNYSKAEERK
jgi:hypothetical protein